MADFYPLPTVVNISENIGLITATHFDSMNGELFTIGFEKIAIENLCGQIIATQELSENSTVIGQQRTPSGWQYLCQKSSVLTNHTMSADNASEVRLELVSETLQTASWSPCGKYVAAGSVGTTLFVWNTQTGELFLQKSINWDNEEEFINPPTLSVTGWSDTGNEIICIAEEVISTNIIIWNLKSQNILTIIQ